jgi:phenylalanyl-tRNA synthetase beta chain
MKLPIAWLREYVDTPLDNDALAHRLTMAGLEVEETSDSDIGPVYHTKVTPNRGDWMSIVGSAREAAAALDLPLRENVAPLPDENDEVRRWAGVRVETPNLCPRFTGKVIRNVKIQPSPAWMQQKLIAAGMRPLNVVVDITNYVMLELGQPLHAYDYDTLPEGRIVVRTAAEGEKLTTLDGIERTLTPEMLLICDAENPIGLAGIMGGGPTEVTHRTRHIFLESAHFDPGVIRRTSKALGLSTEASYRFERFVDPELTPLALERASELLADLAGGEVVLGRIDLYLHPTLPRTISLRSSRTNGILGTDLSEAAIAASLRRLGLAVDATAEPLRVVVPTFRPDLTLEIDLIEEVGRMIGYETLPETLPPARDPQGGMDAPESQFAVRLRSVLTGLGLQEALTNSLVAPSPLEDEVAQDKRVRIRQALSADLSGLRTALVPNLLEALVRNLKRRQPDVRLFEIGKTFTLGAGQGTYDETRHIAGVLTGSAAAHAWDVSTPVSVDFFTAKGIVEALTEALKLPSVTFGPEQHQGMHPGRSASVTVAGKTGGYVAEVDPDWIADQLDAPGGTGRVAVFEIDADALQAMSGHTPRYAPPAKYPAVSRDLAVVVDSAIPYALLEDICLGAADTVLLQDVSLVSIYTGKGVPDGKKSVAIRLTFQAEDRTLVDADVDAQLDAVRKDLAVRAGAEQR